MSNVIVYCLTQVTKGTDGESMDAVSEPQTSVKDGVPELVSRALPRPSEHREEENFVAVAAEKDRESKEAEHKETEATVGPSSASVSPGNQSPSQLSLSTEETISTVSVQVDEPDIISEFEKEGAEVKTEEDLDINEENVSGKGNSLGESPTGPDISVDKNMDKTSDRKKEISADVEMDPEIETEQVKGSLACKSRVSTADDLDEMMDIGTVDQVEQEAQMKVEEENSLMDENSRSPAISNTGRDVLLLNDL